VTFAKRFSRGAARRSRHAANLPERRVAWNL